MKDYLQQLIGGIKLGDYELVETSQYQSSKHKHTFTFIVRTKKEPISDNELKTMLETGQFD